MDIMNSHFITIDGEGAGPPDCRYFFAYHSDIFFVTPSSPGFGTTTCSTCTCSSAVVVVVVVAFWSLPRPRACAPAVTCRTVKNKTRTARPVLVPFLHGRVSLHQSGSADESGSHMTGIMSNETGTIIVPMPVTDLMCQSESADASGSQTPLRSPHSHTHSGFHPAHTAHTHPD